MSVDRENDQADLMISYLILLSGAAARDWTLRNIAVTTGISPKMPSSHHRIRCLTTILRSNDGTREMCVFGSVSAFPRFIVDRRQLFSLRKPRELVVP